MSFFFNEAKKVVALRPKASISPSQRAAMPITTLTRMGCEACPRNNADLDTPKMAPSGRKSAPVYLLGASPSEKEDRQGEHWADKAGDAVYAKFGDNFMRTQVRSNYTVQCAGEADEVETACCRNRIIADIEDVRPLIVVTIGDEAFRWATGAPRTANAMQHRGTLFTARIGRHVCYVLPLMYPNYVFKKSYNKSEYELALEHDVAKIKRLVTSDDLPTPRLPEAPYDGGIQILTGNEPGALATLEAALQDFAAMPDVAVDIETNGLRPYFVKKAQIYMVTVATFERTIVFPLDHPEGWGTDARRKAAWRLFANFLVHSGKKWAHNLAMELEWFQFFFGSDFIRLTEWGDTMAQAHTLDERAGTKALSMQTRIYFGFDVKAMSNIDVTRILDYPLKDTLRYCGLDGKWTDALRSKLTPLVAAENQAEYDRKVRLATTLVLTETVGLTIDFPYAKKLAREYQDKLASIEAKLRRTPEVRAYTSRYGTFSPTAPAHVLTLMRDVCKRDELRKEDRDGTVKWTTGEEALALVPASEVPSVPMILEHRGLEKILGTYLEPVLAMRNVCQDGKQRCKYSSMTAITGRLSAEDPNLQNLPKRKHKEVRGIITAPEGLIMGALDYGQIEFRVVGMASEDPSIVKACWTGYDVHKFWAERLLKLYPGVIDWVVDTFDIDWDEKGLKTLRQEMKNKWVFPQLFGASTQSCAKALHLPDDVTEDLGQEFWDTFRVAKRWQEKLVARYERNLYVECLGGRKCRGPRTKEQVINAPIQGTAADIVTEGMCAVSERAQLEADIYLNPVINVHDDLTYLFPINETERYMRVAAEEMCKPRFDYINVPLVVDASLGASWHLLEEVKVFRSNEIFNTPSPY